MTMATKIIYLKPDGPFHLQTGGGDHETVDLFPRSDSVSAALTYWWFRQYGDISGFPDSLPYHISSVFPAIASGDTLIRLFPKPLGIQIDPESQSHKVFKKIKWVDEALFQAWKNGDDLSRLIPEYSNSDNLKRNGAVWVKDSNISLGTGPLAITDVRTRATVDRGTHATMPFQFVSAWYASDIHFWFYCRFHEEAETRFMSILRLLGDEGLGADRTVGMGNYSVLSSEEERKSDHSETGKWFNLGLYNPDGIEFPEIEWRDSVYQLETRGGWVTGKSLRRKPLVCVAETSVLQFPSPPKGTIARVLDKDDPDIPDEVRPGYSVYRDCRGFFIPCK